MRAVQPLVPAVTAIQRRVALEGSSYTATALAQQGGYVAPAGIVNPDALAGWASDGRDLDGLLMSPAFRTKALIEDGMGARQALAAGGAQLGLLLASTMADTGRTAAGIDVSARNGVGYIRMADPGCCSRCAILAGRWYEHNTGFLRHPMCNCYHCPTTREMYDGAKAEGWVDDPQQLFGVLSEAEQDRIYTKAGAEAIRNGADMNQVVNARRGMTPNGMFTTEGTTRRGVAYGRLAREQRRLTPEAIMLQAKSREQYLELLYRHSYLLRMEDAIVSRSAWQLLLRTGTPAELAAAEAKMRAQVLASAKRKATMGARQASVTAGQAVTSAGRTAASATHAATPTPATLAGAAGGKPPVTPGAFLGSAADDEIRVGSWVAPATRSQIQPIDDETLAKIVRKHTLSGSSETESPFWTLRNEDDVHSWIDRVMRAPNDGFTARNGDQFYLYGIRDGEGGVVVVRRISGGGAWYVPTAHRLDFTTWQEWKLHRG